MDHSPCLLRKADRSLWFDGCSGTCSLWTDPSGVINEGLRPISRGASDAFCTLDHLHGLLAVSRVEGACARSALALRAGYSLASLGGSSCDIVGLGLRLWLQVATGYFGHAVAKGVKMARAAKASWAQFQTQ